MSAEQTIRITVRHHELDVLGHLNNAVYLNYAEEAAIAHAERLDMGIAQMQALGGVFVVRRHEITYFQPVTAGEELSVTTRIVAMAGVRATRQTLVVSLTQGRLVAEGKTEWAWVGNDGRPRRIPDQVLARFPVFSGIRHNEGNG